MKRKLAPLLIIVLSIFFIINPIIAADDDSDWYPFVIPEKLDPNSPVNMGKLVLDAPAGKHGFCKVKDGHFYFEDGTRAKFWGTNLCFSACFPSKENAVILADRIAFFGFNAVRLHHMDFYFEPNGIFEDVSPAYKDPQMKKTGVLSKTQLDKLDYLIYQLKIRGIYIDMNLLVSRKFTEADGIKDAGKLGMAAKPVSMFDEKLIGLQKKYAKDLLTHYNPYTKMRYCDDPAIALVEITNENSIILSWQINNINAIPNLYRTQLDKFWNNWLKEKYGTVDNVKNSWATSSTKSNVSPINFDLTNWTVEQHQNATLTPKASSNSVIINVDNVTAVPWHLQFRTIIPVNKGKIYFFNFLAKANKETKLGVVSQMAESPWTNLGLSETVDLNNEFKYFEITFTANKDAGKAKIGFIVGYSKAEIEIKNVSLKESADIELSEQEKKTDFRFQRPLYKLRAFYPRNRINDIESFYIDLQKEYFKNMVYYLKNELKIKIPITGIGGYSTPEDVITQEPCDFVDKHVYWDHPHFPRKAWDMNDFTIQNISLLLDSNLGFVNRLIVASHDAMKHSKPFTVTEWNHCYPNQYAYETPVFMAQKANENGWDGLFEFAFSEGWKTKPEFDDLQSFFDILANPQKLLLCSIGSYMYLLEEKQIQKLSDSNAVYLFAIDGKPVHDSNHLILMALSEVKNTGSGWNNNRFNWGVKPTLLKKVRIQLNLGKTYKIYMLKHDGSRGKEVQFQEDSPSPWFELITK